MSIPSGFLNPAQTVSRPQVDGVPRLEIVMEASRESFLVSELLHHVLDRTGLWLRQAGLLGPGN